MMILRQEDPKLKNRRSGVHPHHAHRHPQHHFKEVEGGVEMTDIVHYKIPGWIIGTIAHELYIKQQLEGIFEFRTKRVNELFV